LVICLDMGKKRKKRKGRHPQGVSRVVASVHGDPGGKKRKKREMTTASTQVKKKKGGEKGKLASLVFLLWRSGEKKKKRPGHIVPKRKKGEAVLHRLSD